MAEASYTSGGTTIEHNWVDRNLVDRMVHSSDGYQTRLGFTLAGLTAGVATVISLGAGVTHPQPLYLMLAVFGTGSIVLGVEAFFEHRNMKKLREDLDSTCYSFPLSASMQFSAQSAPSMPTVTGNVRSSSGSTMLVSQDNVPAASAESGESQHPRSDGTEEGGNT